MRRRALWLGVALAVALVAYPRPVSDSGGAAAGPGRADLARVLAVWSTGSLRFAPRDAPPYRPVPEPSDALLGTQPLADHRLRATPDHGLAPKAARTALSDRAQSRIDVVADPGPAAARAVAGLLATVERRARVEGELWLVALVERGAGRDGADVLRFGLHGPAALRGPLGPEVALDERWLAAGLTSEQLETWFRAHVAGPPRTAWERWPNWVWRRPAPGAELVAHGDAAEPWLDGTGPPGWTSSGRVARAVGPDGRAWFEAPDGWCTLSQRVLLPVVPGAGAPALEIRLAASFGAGARGTVRLWCEPSGGIEPGGQRSLPGHLELSGTGERRAPLPQGARAALLEVRLTGAASIDPRAEDPTPRVTGVSIRVVPAEE